MIFKTNFVGLLLDFFFGEVVIACSDSIEPSDEFQKGIYGFYIRVGSKIL
jgi:hypothetical protein